MHANQSPNAYSKTIVESSGSRKATRSRLVCGRVVALGVGGMTLFRRYGSQIFPSAALLALWNSNSTFHSDRKSGCVGSSNNFSSIVENILQVLPETAIAVVIGNSIGVFPSLSSTICLLTTC
jgi:hypothetical protein